MYINPKRVFTLSPMVKTREACVLSWFIGRPSRAPSCSPVWSSSLGTGFEQAAGIIELVLSFMLMFFLQFQKNKLLRWKDKIKQEHDSNLTFFSRFWLDHSESEVFAFSAAKPSGSLHLREESQLLPAPRATLGADCICGRDLVDVHFEVAMDTFLSPRHTVRCSNVVMPQQRMFLLMHNDSTILIDLFLIYMFTNYVCRCWSILIALHLI